MITIKRNPLSVYQRMVIAQAGGEVGSGTPGGQCLVAVSMCKEMECTEKAYQWSPWGSQASAGAAAADEVAEASTGDSEA
jgi:hypothetical protein